MSSRLSLPSQAALWYDTPLEAVMIGDPDWQQFLETEARVNYAPIGPHRLRVIGAGEGEPVLLNGFADSACAWHRCTGVDGSRISRPGLRPPWSGGIGLAHWLSLRRGRAGRIGQPMNSARRTLRVLLPVLLACLALLLVVGGTSVGQASLPATVASDPAVATLIAQVTTPALAYELAGLTGERPVTVAGTLYTITTRHSYQTEAISLATRYAYERFAGLGLEVTYHDYTWNGNHWRNVVAEKPGVVDANALYLLTAHLDDMPEGQTAPGADDNGSGSVAVLLAARLLAERRLAYTLRFVLFTGEEQGLRGSAAYAAACRARGEDIRGVVNLDMIAYNSDAQPIVDLWGRAGMTDSLELTRLFSDVIGAYGLNLKPDRQAISDGFPIQYSDQWSFLQQGYPAMLAIEDWDDHTPAYHKITDTLATLDLDYYADFTRAAIATMAHLGRVVPGIGILSGTVRAGDTGQALSATILIPAPAYDYTFTVSTNAAGVYSLSLPVDSYVLTATSPGYCPATVADVQIVTDTVVVQNVILTPCLRLYLPLVLDTGA